MSPRFWPEFIGWLLLLGAILTVWRLATGLPDIDPGEITAEPPADRLPAVTRLAAAAMMIGLVLLIPEIGMVWASALCFVLVIMITRSPGVPVSRIVAVVLLLLLYAFFNHVAGVAVPQSDFVRLP